MNALREASLRVAGAGQFATLKSDRLLEVEKAAARLDHLAIGHLRAPEPWDAFLRRIGLTDG